MNRCPGTKRDGSGCTVTVEPPQTYCWWHDPANAEARKRAAARGGKRAGRGRPQAELSKAKDDIRAVIAGVLVGRIDRGCAAVALQGYNTLLRAIELERKIRETEELEERLAALEKAQEGSQWGA